MPVPLFYPFHRAFVARVSMCVNVEYVPIPPLFFNNISAYAATFLGDTPLILISAALPYRCCEYVVPPQALFFPGVRYADDIVTDLPKWLRIFCRTFTKSESMKIGSLPSEQANSFTLKLVDSFLFPSFFFEYALIAILHLSLLMCLLRQNFIITS